MQKGSVDLKAILWLRNSIVLIVLGSYHGSTDLQLTLCATMQSPRRLHIASTAFSCCRYHSLFAGTFSLIYKYRSRPVNKQFTVPFSLHRTLPHHTAFPSLPATLRAFWNVSTHFFYSSAHRVVASSTLCHLNRRKLNTYRETRPPSWENGTWQVPSQLSHSVWWDYPGYVNFCSCSAESLWFSCLRLVKYFTHTLPGKQLVRLTFSWPGLVHHMSLMVQHWFRNCLLP